VLLTQNNQPKLCDFGLATFGDELHVSRCGTLEYMSPEMLMMEPHNYKTDVWSLGILLF
jgi:p70 ribosomal S6 kinase